ncbi:copper fist DNA binding domain-containing protein [Aspergillus pseudoustus]|uniref:Copper fist DNA binding domain-containing protein n=1 Tax=Aspergillus pseudoustus TaxID=1810923 RepID=A0ABR4KZK3_9EURO
MPPNGLACTFAPPPGPQPLLLVVAHPLPILSITGAFYTETDITSEPSKTSEDMPFDEEGNKWSCDPCLRGHRSSKCQHFDRLMAKVPKSGRPSKKCPHARRNCGCRKSYAIMAPLTHGPKSLCRLVYYASRNSEEPYTPEPYPPSQLDNWHNLIESDFCAQAPQIPDVIDIISQTPKLPTEDSPPSYFPSLPEGLVSFNPQAQAYPTGLGVSLSEGDLAVLTSHPDNTSFGHEVQPAINMRHAYELGPDAHQVGHLQGYTHHVSLSLHGWSPAERTP